MFFNQIRTQRGCQSYLIGCNETGSAILIDPETSQIEHYLGLLNHDSLSLHYILDTHTHADHFSASKQLGSQLNVPIIMHSYSPAPFVNMHVDDGEMIKVGELQLSIMHTPGHTADSISIIMKDRVFTGDTLLIGGTGRTDLPTGDPEQLYTSLFHRLLRLDPELKVYPAHIYSQRLHSTIGEELANNPRLQKRDKEEFVTLMATLELNTPTHLTESLRTNLTGAKPIERLLREAANDISFIQAKQLYIHAQTDSTEFIIIDVREQETFSQGHIKDAINIPRGQLEFRVNEVLPDPTKRIAVCCESGTLSTLATATLRSLGYSHAVALEQGVNAWKQLGYPLVKSSNQ
ncbi:Zn-dependent hydrolase, glyoxylase [Shewanella psychrophila]|uniref:Zn-dependent hydrolase, glyoxylase n=1 Tax=Shewanella psychrophila TaxID=225848 RepID=A0A1S6HQZ1_9GAMM|nr:MBL fold metallo-hydrolase [Shewanella psychrophila]AQS37911.1 Zn-dependent hydrolase, glyoxylase [Shewanella psychrophila]